MNCNALHKAAKAAVHRLKKKFSCQKARPQLVSLVNYASAFCFVSFVKWIRLWYSVNMIRPWLRLIGYGASGYGWLKECSVNYICYLPNLCSCYTYMDTFDLYETRRRQSFVLIDFWATIAMNTFVMNRLRAFSDIVRIL